MLCWCSYHILKSFFCLLKSYVSLQNAFIKERAMYFISHLELSQSFHLSTHARMTFSTQFIEYFYIDLKALNIIDFKEMVDMVTPWLHNQFRQFHLMNISSYSYSAHFAHNTFKMINLLMTVILIFLGPFIYHPVGLIIILCTTQITYKRSFLLYNQSILLTKTSPSF